MGDLASSIQSWWDGLITASQQNALLTDSVTGMTSGNSAASAAALSATAGSSALDITDPDSLLSQIAAPTAPLFSFLPSDTTVWEYAILIIIVLVLVLLILGKVDAL